VIRRRKVVAGFTAIGGGAVVGVWGLAADLNALPDLISGPMPGAMKTDSATLWLRTSKSCKVQIEYWDEGNSKSSLQTHNFKAIQANFCIVRLHIQGLEPGTRYCYRVLLNGIRQDSVGVLSFKTLPIEKTFLPFKVLVGSCAADKSSPIFQAMARESADLMLWLGDNVYFDRLEWMSPKLMLERYLKDREVPALQPLLQATHHYAIWDDHDFGPNDSDGSFVYKAESLELFRRFWVNSSYGLPGVPGIFTSFSFGAVDFFLLDDRYHRTPGDTLEEAKVMFGSEQLDWLISGLQHSQAIFKVVAGGNQFFNDQNRFEGWHQFQQERRQFLNRLENARVSGLIFLSGDRHHTELLKVSRPSTYSLFELTSSSLSSSTYPQDQPVDATEPGTLVKSHNYCTLEFTSINGLKKVLIRSHDIEGRELWLREIDASILQS
jgi:alkaline phosphatase D